MNCSANHSANAITPSSIPNGSKPNGSVLSKLKRIALSHALAAVVVTSWGTGSSAIASESDEQSRRDRIVVEALMRLDGVDVNANPKLSGAVKRYLSKIQDDPSQLKVIQKLKVAGMGEHLLGRIAAWGVSTPSVQAIDLALEQGSSDAIRTALSAEQPTEASLTLAKVLALSNRKEAHDLQRNLLETPTVTKSVRVDAAVGLARSKPMHGLLIELARKDQMPNEAKILIGATLRSSEDAAIKAAANEYFPPLKTSQSALPPIEVLVKRTGNPAEGKILYTGVATCSQCHIIGTEGKNVGPSLSEIGNKLTRESMYVAILSPSAGISHSFEAYSARTSDGEIVTGLLVSDTPQAVTIKDAKGIERTIPRGDLEEFKKQEKSLMPENLQETMSEQGLVDLVEFLMTLKKAS